MIKEKLNINVKFTDYQPHHDSNTTFLLYLVNNKIKIRKFKNDYCYKTIRYLIYKYVGIKPEPRSDYKLCNDLDLLNVVKIDAPRDPIDFLFHIYSSYAVSKKEIKTRKTPFKAVLFFKEAGGVYLLPVKVRNNSYCLSRPLMKIIAGVYTSSLGKNIDIKDYCSKWFLIKEDLVQLYDTSLVVS